MKKLFLITVLFLMSVMTYAQETTNTDKIVVKTSDLTPTQLMKIQKDAEIEALQKKLETYGNWVGVGGEIGNAVSEGLNAVVDVSDKFGKTDVGRFTMIMVAYKVIGKDIIRIVLGLIFMVIFTTFMFRHYKRNFTTRRIVTKSNGWKIWLPKEFKIIEQDNYDGYEVVKFLNILLLLGGFGIIYAIMFA